MRGTTRLVCTSLPPRSLFQSTSPVRGTTTATRRSTRSFRFQSTSPVRGTTLQAKYPDFNLDISIHVPREGDDHAGAADRGEILLFQSTSPVRGTTPPPPPCGTPWAFQSTSPVRGTTSSPRASWSMPLFQSTSPVRGTTDIPDVHVDHVIISIHVPREGDDRTRTFPKTRPSYFNPRPP